MTSNTTRVEDLTMRWEEAEDGPAIVVNEKLLDVDAWDGAGAPG